MSSKIYELIGRIAVWTAKRVLWPEPVKRARQVGAGALLGGGVVALVVAARRR